MSNPTNPSGESFELVPSQPRALATPGPSRLYDYPEDEGVHFWDYWRVISRRRWTIISVFLVTAILVTLWTFTTRPVFTGTATLRIEREQPRVVKFEEVIKESDSQQDYYQTQYKLLQSRTLANRVIGLQQLDQKVEATRYATQFLARQLEETREKLGGSEEKLNRFLKANDILFVAGEKTGQQDLISQQLMLLSDGWLKARSERIARESLVTQASTQNIDSLPAVLQSTLIGNLKHELLNLEGEHKKLAQVFKPDYPRMQQLAEKIAESRRQLRTEIDRAVQALQADYQAAVRNERELEGALAQQRMLARGLADNMAEYNLLRRDVDTSRDLYSALLARLRETQISAALFTSNIYVVDRAEISGTPSRPKRSMNVLVGCIAGLLGGVVLALVFEYLDTNIKDAKDVESVLRVPILGMVPSWAMRRRRELGDGDGRPFALAAQSETASDFAEAFRNLRTSLLYSSPDHPPKTITVTSLQPEDGKTSLATNLAISLVQLGGAEILLIDADMRRPNLHNILAVPQAPGLSTFLTGQAEVADVIAPTSIPNLSVIPAGRSPLNPAELLASARLRQAIDTLAGRFAHIVVDTGPLFGVSDAMILSAQRSEEHTSELQSRLH